MKPVCTNWIVQNQYTHPLDGIPCYRSHGVIYALDHNGERYMVSRIDFEQFDEQNFQYIFTPKWSVIDALPDSVFQGISGLDMSLRLERYYRVNVVPTFISERNLDKNQGKVKKQVQERNPDFYDPIELAMRTGLLKNKDNLIIEKVNQPGRIIYCSLPNDQLFRTELLPDDQVRIPSLLGTAGTAAELRAVLLKIFRSGASLVIEDDMEMLSEEGYCAMMKLLLAQEALNGEINSI